MSDLAKHNIHSAHTAAFIVPGLYEQYQTGVVQAIDEYTLSQAMGANLSVAMEEHYRTFIVRRPRHVWRGVSLTPSRRSRTLPILPRSG